MACWRQAFKLPFITTVEPLLKDSWIEETSVTKDKVFRSQQLHLNTLFPLIKENLCIASNDPKVLIIERFHNTVLYFTILQQSLCYLFFFYCCLALFPVVTCQQHVLQTLFNWTAWKLCQVIQAKGKAFNVYMHAFAWPQYGYFNRQYLSHYITSY